jgi:hypothetical protein
MPLAAPALKSQLRTCFENPPPDAAGCAQAWAAAMTAYATGIVPPSPAVAGAASTLQGTLAAAFGAPNAAPAMESAFTSFAATVGLGMAGFVAVPPPAPVGFAALFSGPKPATHQAAADSIGGAIDTWMKTGVSTLIAPPNTVTPWS